MSDSSEFSLLDLFREEVRSHTATLGEGLLDLEGEAANPRKIEPLMRAAHSIKGAARIVGVDAAVGLAHVMEDAFVAAQNGKIRILPADIDVLLQGTDLLAELGKITEADVADWGRQRQVELVSLGGRILAIAQGVTPAPASDGSEASGGVYPRRDEPGGSPEDRRDEPGGSPEDRRDEPGGSPEDRRDEPGGSPEDRRDEPGGSPVRPTLILPDEPIVPGEEYPLFDLFREEVRLQTAALNVGVLALEQAQTPEIEPLMRAAHSIKGAARIVGVGEAAELAGLEDAFVGVQQGRLRLEAADGDALLSALMVFADLINLTPADVEGWRTRHEDAIRQVKTHLEKPRPALPPAPATELTPAVRMPVGPAAVVEQPAPTLPALPAPTQVVPAAPVVEDAPRPAPEAAEAVVRVTAESLNRLMSLAGESLVQARWLQPFSTSLLKLKKQQDHLAGMLNSVAQALSARPARMEQEPSSRREEERRQEHLERLLDETRKQAALCRQVLAERISEFDDHASLAEDLNSRLYREVIVSRMRPFADGAHGFPRLVRDMARKLERQVRLEIDGLATEVDRDILEKLEAPLTHLLRNAVDHGIEPPEVRRIHGKPEMGLIRLEVRHRAGMLAITISDDGAGIDVKKLAVKIVERGLTRPELAAAMSEAELLEFLFLPGFSTAASLTEYSGRGVGLDVVQTTIRKVGGSVRVTTRPGRGSTFHLQLPITLSVLRAVLVDIAGEPYAFPHNRIDRLIRMPHGDIRSLEHRQYVTVDGRNVGLVLAAQMFDLDAGGVGAGSDLPVLLMSDESGQYGLIVEAFRGEQDLVVRPLDPRLGKVPNISAAAILDDGAPVLIVDVEDLIRSMDHFIQSGSLRRCEPVEGAARRRKRVLVVDDSITVREVERQLLRNEGYDVAVAVDGQDGWNQIRAAPFDLVVSDVDMPRMTGLELVKLIRDYEPLKHVPVIIVSYKDRDEDRLRGLDLGANFYLTKSSFHDNTFLRAVADLIGEA